MGKLCINEQCKPDGIRRRGSGLLTRDRRTVTVIVGHGAVPARGSVGTAGSYGAPSQTSAPPRPSPVAGSVASVKKFIVPTNRPTGVDLRVRTPLLHGLPKPVRVRHVQWMPSWVCQRSKPPSASTVGSTPPCWSTQRAALGPNRFQGV